MKKILAALMFLSWLVLLPSPAAAQVDVKVRIRVPLPPPIVFPGPPEVVVIPETYVYAVPDIQEEIFFYNGWWWRPWEGRWYRSRFHDRDWVYYSSVPAFYKRVPPGWRNEYRDRRWKGHAWEMRRIPHRDMETNWRGWQRGKHWEKENHWGVKGMKPGKQAPGRAQPQFRDDRPGPPAKQTGPPPGQVRQRDDRRDRDGDDDRRGRGRGRDRDGDRDGRR